jgi:N-methylhydantoinase A
MGGTSTDVAPIIGGEVQTTTETVIAGVPIRVPMVDVHTVSAGGGSIAWADAAGLCVSGRTRRARSPVPPDTARAAKTRRHRRQHILGYLADRAELGGEVVLRRELSERLSRSWAAR